MDAFGPFLDGYHNVHVQVWDYLRDRTHAALAEHARLKEDIATPEQLHERAQYVRRSFLASIGGLPETDAPLNPRTTYILRRNGYRIEKVIFESLPKCYVTANLYLPQSLNAPAPAVLFLCGHAREAKAFPEYQRVCNDLARNGFVALAVDPTGQGERISIYDPDSGATPLGWGTTEHTYQGQQCILNGTCIARYFLFDAIRALDYLESRPEVDAARIGVTGNSGGGTQTSLLCMSGEPRLRAAMPCTYVTSREHYYDTGQPQDAEQIQFAMTRNGINYDDMFLPFAPRPLLIGAVASDFFSPEGTELTVSRLKRLYGTLHHADDVDWVIGPGLHMYTKELREAAVNFFSRTIGRGPIGFSTLPDDEIEILPESELWCTPRGHVRTEFPDARTPYHLNLEELPQRPAGRTPADLREAVVDGLLLRERMASPCAMYPRYIKQRAIGEFQVLSLYFRSEPGIMLSACLISREPDAGAPATVVLRDDGTTMLEQVVEAMRGPLDRGEMLLVCDVRLQGALKPHLINGYSTETPRFPSSFFDQYGWSAFCAYCLGDSLLGMQVFDVFRAITFLREHRGLTDVGIHANGLAPALWGYLAAALAPEVSRIHVEGLIPAFAEVVGTERYRTDFTPAHLAHGLLRHFDLPDLAPLFEGRALEVIHSEAAWTG